MGRAAWVGSGGGVVDEVLGARPNEEGLEGFEERRISGFVRGVNGIG